ncbi:putative alcohol dehydrogenase [Cantharellus anzutake]|uniref:putative alcohol dehydrogenase n=1 Tax=Cantharellus anzutake TaxID=1750568 RepID=UPI0019054DDC|nr:putative alcohol dehydrogenase [Cantharellus anzutake]KAF8338751.1 putative alcohol dehydrogenase [Cantharellus anzutake]
MPPLPSRATIAQLMNLSRHTVCPCHACRTSGPIASHAINQFRKFATPVELAPEKEYAFEVAASNLRFGAGVTKEVGMDFANAKASRVGVLTDPNLAKLKPVKTAIESLQANNVPFELFTNVAVEPTDASWLEAIAWARKHNFSHFLAVGGGSVMDTAKAANLFTVYPEADLYDFINAPVGRVPTTAGTGSETTGTAILDIPSKKFKTGIANRALRPTLGIVDTDNTDSCPTEVHISAGLDVLFHAMESYTAIPYYERTPRPANPIQRPAYQGSNPISDVFSMWALRQTIEHLPRVARNKEDKEAKSQMLLAATFAGIGFGNGGVHLCHAASYPISGFNKTGPKWYHPGYNPDKPIIPHGISVALTSPAVFQFTAPSSPSRHREALSIFRRVPLTDPSITRLPEDSIGDHLYEAIAEFLDSLGVPRGLEAVGYGKDDVEMIVQGTLPQRRVLDLAPGIGDVAGEDGAEHLRGIISKSLRY